MKSFDLMQLRQQRFICMSIFFRNELPVGFVSDEYRQIQVFGWHIVGIIMV
jgi:hypothetical protein